MSLRSQASGHAVVVGGGTMGSGIALVFAAGGWTVDLVEPSAAVRASLPAYLGESMARMQGGGDPRRVTVVAGLERVDWTRVDMVCESATEALPVKQAIFAELDRLVPPHVPVTSNSSTLVIEDVAPGLKTTRRMLNLHFLMPAQFVPIVEVIPSPTTDPRLVDDVIATMRALGKRPVRVNGNLTGFLVNRIQAALMREALSLVDRGVASAEDVDAAVRYGFGFRYAACGPIVQKEHSGWEICTQLYRKVFPTLCNDPGPTPGLEAMLAAGHYGMKTGRGFMPWDQATTERERARYEKALRAALDVLAMEADNTTSREGGR